MVRKASCRRGVMARAVSAEQGKRGLDMPDRAVSLVGAQCAPGAPHSSDSANRLMGVGIADFPAALLEKHIGPADINPDDLESVLDAGFTYAPEMPFEDDTDDVYQTCYMEYGTCARAAYTAEAGALSKRCLA